MRSLQVPKYIRVSDAGSDVVNGLYVQVARKSLNIREGDDKDISPCGVWRQVVKSSCPLAYRSMSDICIIYKHGAWWIASYHDATAEYYIIENGNPLLPPTGPAHEWRPYVHGRKSIGISPAPILEAERRPFKRWRCLWRPHMCVPTNDDNVVLCEPVAKLSVKVEQAIRLPVPVYADTYVKLGLDTNIAPQFTKAKKSAAPRWKEEKEEKHFVKHFDVYHTSSTLQVCICRNRSMPIDSDFFRLDDKCVGYLDIDLQSIPLNQWISGWFDLTVDHRRSDSIEENRGRDEDAQELVSGTEKPKIHLQLRLDIGDEFDEFFSTCLPLPAKVQHRSNKVDIGYIFMEIMMFLRKVELWTNKVKDYQTRIARWMTPCITWLLCVLFVWIPTLILPVMVVLVVFVATQNDKRLRRDLQNADQLKRGNTIKSGTEQTFIQKMMAPRKLYQDFRVAFVDATPLLNDQMPPRLEPAPSLTSQEETNEQQEETKKREALLSLSKMLSKNGMWMEEALQKEDLKEVREALNQTYTYAVESLTVLQLAEQIIKHSQTPLFGMAKLMSCVLALLLWHFRDWQHIFIQISLTLYATQLLWENSIPRRLWISKTSYQEIRKKREEGLVFERTRTESDAIHLGENKYIDNWGEVFTVSQDGSNSINFKYRNRVRTGTLSGNTLQVVGFETPGTVNDDGTVTFEDGGSWTRMETPDLYQDHSFVACKVSLGRSCKHCKIPLAHFYQCEVCGLVLCRQCKGECPRDCRIGEEVGTQPRLASTDAIVSTPSHDQMVAIESNNLVNRPAPTSLTKSTVEVCPGCLFSFHSCRDGASDAGEIRVPDLRGMS